MCLLALTTFEGKQEFINLLHEGELLFQIEDIENKARRLKIVRVRIGRGIYGARIAVVGELLVFKGAAIEGLEAIMEVVARRGAGRIGETDAIPAFDLLAIVDVHLEEVPQLQLLPCSAHGILKDDIDTNASVGVYLRITGPLDRIEVPVSCGEINGLAMISHPVTAVMAEHAEVLVKSHVAERRGVVHPNGDDLVGPDRFSSCRIELCACKIIPKRLIQMLRFHGSV